MKQTPAVGGFTLAGVLLSLIIGRIATLGPLRDQVPAFLGWFGVAFAFYGVALAIVGSVSRGAALSKGQRTVWLGVILTVAAVSRVALCFSPPSLSDDIYRYLWEGRVQLVTTTRYVSEIPVQRAKFNPFEHPPNDPALSVLRDESYEKINNKHVSSIYPPLMQALFRLGAWIAPTILCQKLLFLMGDVAVLWLLLVMLPSLGRDPRWLTVYAWNPLVLVEFAGSGHNDSWGIFWLLLGVWFWERRRVVKACQMLAIGTLTKWLPLVTLVPMVINYPRSPRFTRGIFLLTFFGIVGLGWLPFLGASHWLPHGLSHYGTHWSFNAGLYDFCQRILGDGALTKTVLGVELLLLSLWLAIHRADRSLLWYSFVMVGAGLLCSPVVHPWYVVWIIPFLCFYPRIGWIGFSGLVVLSYLVLLEYQVTDVWALNPWVRIVEYVPLFVALLWPWLRTHFWGQVLRVAIC